MKAMTKKALEASRLTSLWFGSTSNLCLMDRRLGDLPGLPTRMFYPPEAADDTGTYWTYDRQGNLLVAENRYRIDGVMHWDRIDCVYEGRGELHKGKLVYMTNTSSRFPPWPVYRATYNANDQIDVETEEFDFNHDGMIDTIAYTRYYYDANGLLVEQLFEADDDANGTIDYRLAAAMASYDERYRLRRLVKGYFDGPNGSFSPYHTWSIAINDADRFSIATEETDYDGDGVSDYTYRWTTFLDEAGRTARALTESDLYGGAGGGADGVFDSFSVTQNEYDAAGNLVHVVFDSWGIGTLTFRDDYVNTYDTKGGLIGTVYNTWTWIGDFVVSEGYTTSYTRNQHGRVLEEVEVRQTPWFTQTTRVKNTFSGIGNLVETLWTFQNNDEEPSVLWHIGYEYAAGRSGQTRGK